VKKAIAIILLLTIASVAQAQLPIYPDSLFSTYYHQRWTLFQALPQTKDDIIFIGNSITDGGEWSELFQDLRVKNRGISGDISAGVLKRIDEVVKRKPAKVFLMIGTNDLARGISTDSAIKNILHTAAWLKQESPATKLFVQSILPVSDVYKKFSGHTSKTDSILKLNNHLSKVAETYEYTFVNLYPSFCNQQGKLDEKYSNDGLHLAGEGYLLWKHLVFPYAYDVQKKPSLLPLPQQLKWDEGYFSLYCATSIILNDTALDKEAKQLKEIIANKGRQLEIKNKASNGEVFIELRLEKNSSVEISDESYTLHVTEHKISIAAKTTHGIFNAIQTLKQLMRDGMLVDACEITDQPAFSWRGYMIDVGRNYMSMKLLKEQIDVMAAFKLNIFHFHLTEDIAWRLQSKQYPQLTDAKYMLRNPGEFYSQGEMKELIAYCKERYIALVPEIDMPGHSAAFKRAMGVDMQSDSGLVICKNILKEICRELDVPIIHIGGDEVKITNKNFLPAMIQLLCSLRKTVVAWNPGGNVPEGTHLQMWNGKTVPKNKFPSIDSRHLYLNHLDPLEGVSATFNHIICDTTAETAERKGATLCLWPDRRVSKEEDMISMNAVYPVMLSFAERCWQGGGYKNFSSVIDAKEKEAYLQFAAFEKRLLEQKKLYFKKLPFPYVEQAAIEWKMIGPFYNKGNTSFVFAPEKKIY
jgi:hexosaminidase